MAVSGEIPLVLLGEAAEFINGDRGSNYPSPTEFVVEGIPFISAADLVDGHVALSGVNRISDLAFGRLGNGKVQAGDLLFCLRGSLGKVARVTGQYRGAIASSLVILRPKGQVDSRYLYYILAGPLGQELARELNNGSVQPNISARSLKGAEIPLPSLPKQRAIAHILGTLDDKIEVNRRMNATLEAMARGLFKSWFVDFDPVRAKAEGRDPGLPPHLADLFPDSFENSVLGAIPRGWRVGSVDDEFTLTMGQSPPGETYNAVGDGLPFYQGCTDFGFRFPMRRVYCTAPTRYARAGDTLVSVRAPVGDTNLATECCAIGRGVAAARHKTGSRSYSYQFMLSIKGVFAQFEAEGTVFGSIGKKDFHAIPCVIPPQTLVSAFEAPVAGIDDHIEVNEVESRTLAALRDTLLPKLISGELRVKDAERMVDKVLM